MFHYINVICCILNCSVIHRPPEYAATLETFDGLKITFILFNNMANIPSFSLFALFRIRTHGLGPGLGQGKAKQAYVCDAHFSVCSLGMRQRHWYGGTDKDVFKHKPNNPPPPLPTPIHLDWEICGWHSIYRKLSTFHTNENCRRLSRLRSFYLPPADREPLNVREYIWKRRMLPIVIDNVF